MSRTTITVSISTKKLLDILRKNKEWDEFLRELALTALRLRRKNALAKLKKLISKEDLEEMEKIYQEMKVKWHLKTT